MNIKSPTISAFRGFIHNSAIKLLCALAVVAGSAALNVQAAYQTWTNAPVDATWTNVNNWVNKAVPGAFVAGGGVQNGDMVTFNSALSGGIGGSANPILIDVNTNSFPLAAIVTNREIGGMVFDTANCGAYVVGLSNGYNLQLTAAFSGATTGSNITVTASVVNPITINAPVHFHYASSSNGGYSLTNNAAPSTATLQLNMITNDSASSRPLTLTLAGSNTGFNSIGHFDDNNGANGSVHLTKSGTGRWVFTGPNDFPQKKSAGDNINANIAIINGTLEVQAAGSLGAITEGNFLLTNAVLQIDGVTLANTGITVQNGGTILMNGAGNVNGVSVGATPGVSITLATTNPTDVLTIGTAANAVTAGAADSVIHVAGPGTVYLPQPANYLGKWSIDAGTGQLATATSLGATPPGVNISAGGMLDVTPLTTSSATFTFNGATLTAKGTGTAIGSTAAALNADPSGTIDFSTGSKVLTLTFTPTGFTGDTTHPALYMANGTLKLGNNPFNIVNNTGTPLGTGTYTLIQQATGSITDLGGYSVLGVTGGGIVGGDVASIVVSGGSLNLVVAPYVPQNLVWTGGAANANWDIATSANWLDGAVYSVFHNSDNVTFNSVGSTNPVVNVTTTVSEGSMVVDTTANNYTFSGAGSISGTGPITKNGTGTLLLSTANNSYSGGTTVNNGVFQLGVANAISDIGTGDVAVQSPAKLDMNGFSDIINGLNGSGTIDTVSGGAPVLTMGNNNDGGTFSGVIQNTAGTLAIVKGGNGTQVLTAANTYTGTTTINAGTLSVANYNGLGLGASAVTVNGGNLDLQTNVLVNSLAGAGNVVNNFTSRTNVLTITNGVTFNGAIADGTGGGGIALRLTAGTMRMNGASTFSGGTIVGGGATIGEGPGASLGTGGILMSNGTTFFMYNNGSSASGPIDNITIVNGAGVSLNSGQLGNGFGGTVSGGPTSTNYIIGPVSFGTGNAEQYTNFPGVVQIQSGGSLRFSATTLTLNGSDTATFDLEGSGVLQTRNAGTVHLGALQGNGFINNPQANTGTGNFEIGFNNNSTTFSGYITGTNSIVKVGTGTLTLSGGLTNLISSPDGGLTFNTNAVPFSDALSYVGNTTVSNGVLQLLAPTTLTNWPTPITLASSTAVLDVSQMGYINTDNATFTNVVTNGVFEVVSGQTLAGVGTIRATNVLMDASSILNVGLPTGLLTVSDTSGITLAGAVNMFINTTNSVNSELAAPSFTVSPGATLSITNIGTNYAGTVVYHMFSSAIVTNNFAAITLPTVTSPIVISNWLSLNGTLVVVAPPTVNPNPTNIVFTVNGSTLNLSWPPDHTGWHLQIQTNTLANGLGTNWVTLVGAESVFSTNMTVNPNNGSVFYRLTYP